MKNTILFFALAVLMVFTQNSNAQFWQQTNGPGGDNTQSVAVAPNGTIFVASRALHRSTDDGKTWQRILQDIPIWYIQKVVAQPSGAIIVFVNPYYQDIPNTLLRSTDNGDSWTKLPIDCNYYGVAISGLWSSGAGKLFAFDDSKLMLSTDDGVQSCLF